jgi:hypothetical protein
MMEEMEGKLWDFFILISLYTRLKVKARQQDSMSRCDKRGLEDGGFTFASGILSIRS